MRSTAPSNIAGGFLYQKYLIKYIQNGEEAAKARYLTRICLR